MRPVRGVLKSARIGARRLYRRQDIGPFIERQVRVVS